MDAAFTWLVVGLGKNTLSMSETTSIVVSVLGNKKSQYRSTGDYWENWWKCTGIEKKYNEVS